MWDASADGKFLLSLLADNVQMAEVPGLSMIVAGTTPVIASAFASVIVPGVLGSGSGPAKSAIQELIITTTLGIPAHLTDHSTKAKVNICVAYAKYIAACKAMSKLVTSETWTHKAVNNDDMIEIFMSKCAYFKNHAKVFCLVKQSTIMQKWLENADDAPADYKAWGYSKHTFNTLKTILTVLPDPVTPTVEGDRRKGKRPGIYHLLPIFYCLLHRRRRRGSKLIRREGRERLVRRLAPVRLIMRKLTNICGYS